MEINNRLVSRVVIAAGGLYLILLLAAVGYTSFAYRQYYSPPEIPSGLGEDAVLELWAQRYEVRYREYGGFLSPIGTGLALGLGVWAAAVGLWRRSLWQGLAALAAGGAVTVAALSILPWVYFPFDQYPASALWVMGRAPVLAATWIAATVVGQILIRRNAL